MDMTAILEKLFGVLIGGALLSYFASIISSKYERQISGLIAVTSIGAGLYLVWQLLPKLGTDIFVVTNIFGFLGLNVNLLSWIIVVTCLVLSFFVALYSVSYMDEDTGTNKFFPLLILLAVSVIGLAFTSDLFNLYIFFELLSIASFALVSYRKKEWAPVEAGIKFLVMSSIGSALILLGIALAYMQFGVLDFTALFSATQGQGISWIVFSCFLVGFGVKAAMFPLHTWLPDAHSEAPSGISAMLSGIVIEIGFFSMIRIFFYTGHEIDWGKVLLVFGAVTMTAGNIMALTQKHIKRMLAYSSVAQIGYIMLAFGIGMHYGVKEGVAGGMFHIVTHAFMKGLAFLCAGALIYKIGSSNIDDMHGAGWKMPLTGIAYTIAVLSLAGVPPFSGFMSKLLIYQSGIKAGYFWGWFAAILAIANSVFSLGYYLPSVWSIYSKNHTSSLEKIKEVPFAMKLSLAGLAILTVYLGISPDPVRAWSMHAFSFLINLV